MNERKSCVLLTLFLSHYCPPLKCTITDQCQWLKYQRCNWCSCTGAQTPSGANEGRRRRKKKLLSRIATGPFCEWNSWGRVGKVTLSGLDACQSWLVSSRHLSAVSAAERCGPVRCMSLSLGQESYHTVTYQIIAGAFICFNNLTDQEFIWDQAAIWDRQYDYVWIILSTTIFIEGTCLDFYVFLRSGVDPRVWL